MTKKAAAKKSQARPAAKKAAPARDFDALFEHLRKLLLPYAKHMVVKYDGPGIYYLETAPVAKYGTEVFFGAVKASKRHVSFHLMPVYVFPELLEGISPALRKRLEGESCFNFTQVEPALLRELATLTRQGYQGYRRGGLFAA
jgi:hypothetical protein